MNTDTIDNKIVQLEFDFIPEVNLQQHNKYILDSAKQYYQELRHEHPYATMSFDTFFFNHYLPTLHGHDNEQYKRLHTRNI